jgi:hypothetical protein
MKRNYEIRISSRMDKLVRMSQIMTHASEGKKLTKGAMAERLIGLGALILSKEQEWEIPDDLRP